jgi:hypothetical protein
MNLLQQNIQKWILIDNKLKTINDHAKKLRDMKTEIGEQITQYINENNLADKKITIENGELLRLTEKKEYTPLSFTFIEVCLDNIIEDKHQVASILEYIKDQRELTVSKELRRFNK